MTDKGLRVIARPPRHQQRGLWRCGIRRLTPIIAAFRGNVTFDVIAHAVLQRFFQAVGLREARDRHRDRVCFTFALLLGQFASFAIAAANPFGIGI